ncbi:MAG TPA: hypothetical protein VGN63_08635 [Flavisolibacter sp.]|jgi:hypothetical protein|nr:hypothetical protein [Flavisolibacter sp.]
MIKANIIVLISLVLFLSSCQKDGGADAAASTGKGGSLARFTIVGNYLYLADYNTIEVFDISNPASTEKKSSVNVGFGVETIFPYKDKLFIGSMDGMYIYDLADPKLPKKLGEARHVRSCDPVVANDSIAYVTLRGSGNCGAATDGLYTYNITNLTNPVQKSLLPLSSPYGLGLKDTVVFVCRAGAGLSVVNVKKPEAPTLMYTLKDDTYLDVIPYDDLLICYVQSGILVYDTKNLNQITKLGNFVY